MNYKFRPTEVLVCTQITCANLEVYFPFIISTDFFFLILRKSFKPSSLRSPLQSFPNLKDKSWKKKLTVLQCPLENSLYVKAEKCEDHVSSVTFLGYIFKGQREKIRVDPEKVGAMCVGA